jgi:cell division septation protein DedD
MLEDKLHSVNEINLPDDVTLLLGETDAGVVGDVTVRPAARVTPAPSFAAGPAAAPAQPAEALKSDSEPTSASSQATRQMAPVDPPSPGFVQSVSLGELAAPTVEPEVELVEPGEFNLPGFDSFGEREDDNDIEEID